MITFALGDLSNPMQQFLGIRVDFGLNEMSLFHVLMWFSKCAHFIWPSPDIARALHRRGAAQSPYHDPARGANIQWTQ